MIGAELGTGIFELYGKEIDRTKIEYLNKPSEELRGELERTNNVSGLARILLYVPFSDSYIRKKAISEVLAERE